MFYGKVKVVLKYELQRLLGSLLPVVIARKVKFRAICHPHIFVRVIGVKKHKC